MPKQKQILVFNAGSTSLKYKLFQGDDLKVLKENDFQNLNKKDGHLNALKKALREIGDLTDIKVIGHRVVHGGNEFCQPAVVNEKVIKEIKEFANEAPLHNPYQLKVLESTQNYFPDTIEVVVFDTAFFNTLPEKAKIYAIPLKYYQQGVQRFGFHGISHQYVAKKAAEKMKRKLSLINLITCHLGGGCSVAAIAKGEAVDTSMGFTPLEGLVMMTRPGDLDPGLVFHLNQDLGLSKEEIYNLFNFQSGIKGLFGQSDFKKLLSAVKRGDKKAKLAFDIFIYRIQKYISAYAGILKDVQAVVFTGAIGSGDPYTVKKIKQGLPLLDKVEILRIKTDEEKAIAEECQRFLF
jgi:acetate kinase